jgi:arsenate reductase-like glutaredoxin family protein
VVLRRSLTPSPSSVRRWWRCATPRATRVNFDATTLSVRRLSSSVTTPPTLWHNPGCSKSRAALELLKSRGEPFETRHYLEEKPTFGELQMLTQALRMPPIEWARTTEPEWLDRFDNATIYDDLLPDGDDILRAMAECASRQRESRSRRLAPFALASDALHVSPKRISDRFHPACADPIIIERPILVCGTRAIVGRPKPDRILTLLQAAPAAAGASRASKSAVAIQALAAAADDALERGVAIEAVEERLLRTATELDSLQP